MNSQKQTSKIIQYIVQAGDHIYNNVYNYDDYAFPTEDNWGDAFNLIKSEESSKKYGRRKVRVIRKTVEVLAEWTNE